MQFGFWMRDFVVDLKSESSMWIADEEMRYEHRSRLDKDGLQNSEPLGSIEMNLMTVLQLEKQLPNQSSDEPSSSNMQPSEGCMEDPEWRSRRF